MSKCQIELDISWDKIISHPADGQWQKIAPLRILSFDIECKGRKGVFPEPEHDSVIQIANIVSRQGEREPFIKNVFTLDTCAPIVGSEVRPFSKRDEGSMLEVRLQGSGRLRACTLVTCVLVAFNSRLFASTLHTDLIV